MICRSTCRECGITIDEPARYCPECGKPSMRNSIETGLRGCQCGRCDIGEGWQLVMCGGGSAMNAEAE